MDVAQELSGSIGGYAEGGEAESLGPDREPGRLAIDVEGFRDFEPCPEALRTPLAFAVRFLGGEFSLFLSPSSKITWLPILLLRAFRAY